MTTPAQPPPWLPSPRRPPPRPLPPVRGPAGVPVYVDTSDRIWTRYGRGYPMLVEFVPPGTPYLLRGSARHQFFLPPGVYRAQFYTSYFGIRVGKADAVVDTRSGQPVYVGYAAPYTIWTKGAAGYPPVKRPGIAAFLGIVAVAIGIGVITSVVALLVSLR